MRLRVLLCVAGVSREWKWLRRVYTRRRGLREMYMYVACDVALACCSRTRAPRILGVAAFAFGLNFDVFMGRGGELFTRGGVSVKSAGVFSCNYGKNGSFFWWKIFEEEICWEYRVYELLHFFVGVVTIFMRVISMNNGRFFL